MKKPLKKFKAKILYNGCKLEVMVKASKKLDAKKHIILHFKNSKIITINPIVYML